MTLLEIAIRAACAADPHFVLNRKPEMAQGCLSFVLAAQSAGAEAVYIRAHAGKTVEPFARLKPEQRSAWEIYRATVLILNRLECEEAEKARCANPVPGVAPLWMLGRADDVRPGLGDHVTIGMPMAAAPAPAAIPLPERKKIARKKA